MCRWKIGGVTCSCSLLFPAVLLVLLLADDSGILGYGVLAALVHECGHLIAMLCVREKPQAITLSFYGIRIVWAYNSVCSGLTKAWVAIAGPLSNLLCAGLLCGAENAMFRAMHLGLALFNLLPLFPLDGAAALNGVLGERVTRSEGYLMAEYTAYILLILCGTAVMLMNEHNPTLFFTSAYIFILRLFYKRN